MAKKNKNTQQRASLQNTSKIESRSFSKGMMKDVNESVMPDGAYLNAINAVNHSRSGDMGIISNEPSNEFCVNATYQIIGTIHLYEDKWAIFSTDDTNSEIGIFDESDCSYQVVANDVCLNFKKKNLIIGQSKENFDCTWQVYWADGLNPDRYMNLDNPPWIQDCGPDPQNEDCIICRDTDRLDCDKLRIARLTTPPCLSIKQGPNGGELLNGTYQACIAYTENEQRVSDYSTPSVPVSIFDHRNVNGSLDVIIEDIDRTYDEFELVIIGVVNQKTVATRVGIYSTRQTRISVDSLPATLPTVPLRLIPLDRPAYEKSEGIYRNGEYLIRVAPTSRFSFNYQPIANQIQTEWVAAEYPPDYYRKAGKNTGYLRDENYAFFIRWIYDTYDKSESYHIPGRPPGTYYNYTLGSTISDFATIATAAYAEPELVNGITPYVWRCTNTATRQPASGTTDDGGIIVARGKMGYWESTEKYPDDKPDVWAELCGKHIRHHKMPDNEIINHFNDANGKIAVLGVQFSNIGYPVDNNNNPIPGIIGYEILRGTREGNKTIIAKGLLNNMGKYEREDTNTYAYYQNYPYNDLRRDPFLANDWITGDKGAGNKKLGLYDRNKFTFHSPDTQFKHPFLSSRELKIYETLYGTVEGRFSEPYLHPKHKLITNVGFILGALIGFGIGMIALSGERKRTVQTASARGIGLTVGPVPAGTTAVGDAAGAGAAAGSTAARLSGDSLDYAGTQIIGTLLFGTGRDELSLVNTAYITVGGSYATAANLIGADGGTFVDEYQPQGRSGLPAWYRAFQAIPTFLTYWGQGTDKVLDLIRLMSRWRQHALQFQSHCFHDQKNTDKSGTRTVINDASYLDAGLMRFSDIDVNNLFRNACVAILTRSNLPNPTVTDNSRLTADDAFGGTDDLELDKQFTKYNNGTPITASAHYVGLKTRLANQYGQVDGVIQVPLGECMQEFIIDPENPEGATSEVLFGGDTYIGRYTEKSTFYYFTNWMFDLPDGFEYDYRLYKMMPYPTYWMDTQEFDLQTFFNGIFGIFSLGSGTLSLVPSNFHNFDRSTSGVLSFLVNIFSPLVIRNAYMYLFNSGVRDFFVESEINIEYRDWEDTIEERHYDPYRFKDYWEMFRSDRIKAPNLYKYDYSLSVSRLYQNFASWGRMQYRNYDPQVAETCYSYYPNRLIYSLPQSKEARYDNWLIYLINNFKDFSSRVVSIKPVGKNGAMIFFENEAPALIPGVDTLQTDAGTKITIGDGGLFSQPLQNIVNVETPYEYGSCQNRLSVINTPAGLYWISRNQGKIFSYTGGLEDISQNGMKWWFEEFLPYKILDDFPTFEIIDNPVAGVGCQSIYNNNNGTVYFAKKDYKLKPNFRGRVTYLGGCDFAIGAARFILGDERYFDDASWTASYDPKSKTWVSFHDWHPDLMMPGKNEHMTIKNRSIWIHNDRSDSYCNFYGDDYPFEVDLVVPTGQNVNTLKSIEYFMEVYQWDQETDSDRHHVLDFNFDRAIVYNTEQVSGELRLNLTPKNNAPEIVNYPQVNPSSIDILYSKEEQRYRFNQFWDITDDRGEFSTAVRRIWQTEPNGYRRNLNPLNMNYFKPIEQRKKFRHYQNYVRLRRRVSGPNDMQLKVVNMKNQYSMR